MRHRLFTVHAAIGTAFVICNRDIMSLTDILATLYNNFKKLYNYINYSNYCRLELCESPGHALSLAVRESWSKCQVNILLLNLIANKLTVNYFKFNVQKKKKKIVFKNLNR